MSKPLFYLTTLELADVLDGLKRMRDKYAMELADLDRFESLKDRLKKGIEDDMARIDALIDRFGKLSTPVSFKEVR